MHSDYHRRGIGTSLLGQAVSWAQNRCYQRVRLCSGIQREPAHRFYENRGFLRQRASDAFELALPQNEPTSLPVMLRGSGA
ncbi:GNAT family N-acetyltransferase [Undibacterium oligocarboniphilum]|uniref:GNAT family N-acetyltransferase n=1 Tax=Undibacterium oligocarboniphilum TaxID=666702 RepID=A0A850QF65_9BURK|nr:GNAT family N-acetyltransferase [Undibacterium oligocarboniphilum]MBC3869450.1 GNAT family N-acetyltransferase [Undibacterium oligocarboniphilum]NVO77829.1 GNAT family N-acetyltransferase [Undibacterium oligocarboniphilum]